MASPVLFPSLKINVYAHSILLCIKIRKLFGSQLQTTAAQRYSIFYLSGILQMFGQYVCTSFSLGLCLRQTVRPCGVQLMLPCYSTFVIQHRNVPLFVYTIMNTSDIINQDSLERERCVVGLYTVVKRESQHCHRYNTITSPLFIYK